MTPEEARSLALEIRREAEERRSVALDAVAKDEDEDEDEEVPHHCTWLCGDYPQWCLR